MVKAYKKLFSYPYGTLGCRPIVLFYSFWVYCLTLSYKVTNPWSHSIVHTNCLRFSFSFQGTNASHLLWLSFHFPSLYSVILFLPSFNKYIPDFHSVYSSSSSFYSSSCIQPLHLFPSLILRIEIYFFHPVYQFIIVYIIFRLASLSFVYSVIKFLPSFHTLYSFCLVQSSSLYSFSGTR